MNNRLYQDIWLYRMVVTALGLTVMASVARAIVLTGSGEFTPEIILALGSAVIGGFACLLAPSPLTG